MAINKKFISEYKRQMSRVDDGDVIIIEDEEEKENLSLLDSKNNNSNKAPLIHRFVASTSNNSSNASTEEGGKTLSAPDYSSRANAIIASANVKNNHVIEKVRYSHEFKKQGKTPVTGRRRSRGR